MTKHPKLPNRYENAQYKIEEEESSVFGVHRNDFPIFSCREFEIIPILNHHFGEHSGYNQKYQLPNAQPAYGVAGKIAVEVGIHNQQGNSGPEEE